MKNSWTLIKKLLCNNVARIAGDYAKWNKSGKEKYSMIPLHMESKITQHSQIKSQNHLRAFHLHIEQTSGYQWGQVRGDDTWVESQRLELLGTK